MEIASFALRTPIFRVDTWEVIRVEIARPAASSFAELMRRPVDRRSIETPIDLSFRATALAASVAETFVLITLIFLASISIVELFEANVLAASALFPTV
jgi:hypothetical protein